MLATERERHELCDLEQQYGTLLVLLAFYHFLDRRRGTGGLSYPLLKFAAEASSWVPFAIREATERSEHYVFKHNPDALEKIRGLCESLSYPTDQQSLLQLFDLSVREGDENDDLSCECDLKAVEDFLRSNPAVVHLSSPVLIESN